jgi:homoserine kinase
MRSSVVAYAPGSTSNLGPGFDCLGVAFTGRGDRVTARLAAEPGVRVVSVSDPRIPTDPARNTAAIAAAWVLRESDDPPGLELVVEKGLPLCGGLGGSAASAVAGAVAADALLGLRLPRSRLMAAALEAEAVVAGRHADNVAPSLYGGAVLIRGLDPVEIASFQVHPDLALVLVTPDYAVETARARAVLPGEVSRADAVAQASRLACLVLGLERGDERLIRGSLVDLIAEPARRPLYPGYPEARTAGLVAGALGVTVSGAGPTVVAVVRGDHGSGVAEAMVDAYESVGYPAEAHVASVDAQGARVMP